MNSQIFSDVEIICFLVFLKAYVCVRNQYAILIKKTQTCV